MPATKARPKPQGKLRIVCPRQAVPIDLELSGDAPEPKSKAEGKLLAQLRRLGVPEPLTQYRFHSVRMWRLDFAWPDRMIAVEVQGMVHGGVGGHQTIGGIIQDCEKLNAATAAGWRIFVYTQSMLTKDRAAREIAQVLLGIDGARDAEARAAGEAVERDREARRGPGAAQEGDPFDF